MRSLLEFKGAWVGDDLDEIAKVIEQGREESRSRVFEI